MRSLERIHPRLTYSSTVENRMRAEAEALVESIKQAVGLLRRHL